MALGRILAGPLLLHGVHCLCRVSCKTNAQRYFYLPLFFFFFFVKAKSSLDFLWLVKTVINVGLLEEPSGTKGTFKKMGDTCIK